MRIALVCPYSLSVPGGVQHQVRGLASALRGLGHHVVVVAPVDGAEVEPDVVPAGSSTAVPANGSVAPVSVSPRSLVAAWRSIAAAEPDVVHVHEPLAPGVGLLALARPVAPVVATFHRSGSNRAYRALAPAARALARRASSLCAVSEDAEATAADLLGIPQGATGGWERLWNGVDVEGLASADPWPTEPGTRSVLFVGRHEPRKGLAVLLQAASDLPPDVRVWVAGDGPETAALRRRWADDARIEWLGRISDGEKAARLKAATLACFPSLGGESFGIVLAEAMAAGTPVVASDIDGYRKVARPDASTDAAALAPAGDALSLARELNRLLGDAGARAALVDAGRRRARELSMGRLAEAYVAVYRRASAEGARPGRAGRGIGRPSSARR